jgi:hypothetical protein
MAAKAPPCRRLNRHYHHVATLHLPSPQKKISSTIADEWIPQPWARLFFFSVGSMSMGRAFEFVHFVFNIKGCCIQ